MDGDNEPSVAERDGNVSRVGAAQSNVTDTARDLRSTGDLRRDDVGNTPAARGQGETVESDDPYAYRNAHENLSKRMEHMERCVIDLAYGGSIARFDEAAGLNRDAKGGRSGNGFE